MLINISSCILLLYFSHGTVIQIFIVTLKLFKKVCHTNFLNFRHPLDLKGHSTNCAFAERFLSVLSYSLSFSRACEEKFTKYVLTKCCHERKSGSEKKTLKAQRNARSKAKKNFSHILMRGKLFLGTFLNNKHSTKLNKRVSWCVSLNLFLNFQSFFSGWVGGDSGNFPEKLTQFFASFCNLSERSFEIINHLHPCNSLPLFVYS